MKQSVYNLYTKDGYTIMGCSGYCQYSNELRSFYYDSPSNECRAYAVSSAVYAIATCCRLNDYNPSVAPTKQQPIASTTQSTVSSITANPSYPPNESTVSKTTALTVKSQEQEVGEVSSTAEASHAEEVPAKRTNSNKIIWVLAAGMVMVAVIICIAEMTLVKWKRNKNIKKMEHEAKASLDEMEQEHEENKTDKSKEMIRNTNNNVTKGNCNINIAPDEFIVRSDEESSDEGGTTKVQTPYGSSGKISTNNGGEEMQYICAYCGLLRMGKVYDSDGMFYCKDCWRWYTD